MTSHPELRAGGPRLYWWREVAYIAAFYAVYSFVRNQFGSASVSPEEALDNALVIIDIEKAMGLFIELDVQEAFLDQEWFLRIWNIFYGTFHFVVTAGVLLFLFKLHPSAYQRWRNTLAATTGLAIIGFAAFPLMPPRLLDAGGRFGGSLMEYPFVDTLEEIGGLWSFSSGGMAAISNQYAAMPSLHIGWAVWCVLAAYPFLHSTTLRVLLVAYPFATLFAITVTANHYWLDAVGGLVVLGAGYGVAIGVERVGWVRSPDAEVDEEQNMVNR